MEQINQIQDDIQEQKEGLTLSKMPPESDNSHAAQLARAIVAKDATTVHELMGKVSLKGRYLGAFWGHRMIENFDIKVAQILVSCKLRLSYPRQLYRKALDQGNAEALTWLLDNSNLSEFNNKKNRNYNFMFRCYPWMNGDRKISDPTERDVMIACAIIYCPDAPHMAMTMLRRSNGERLKNFYLTHSYNFLFNNARVGDWENIEEFVEKLNSLFPREIVKEKLTTQMVKMASCGAAPLALDIEKAAPGFSFGESIFSDFPRELDTEGFGRTWKLRTNKRSSPLSVENIHQVALVSATPCTVELLEDPQLAQWYKEKLSQPNGWALMANLAHLPAKDMAKIMPIILPALDAWEDPEGYTPAHVMMCEKPTAALFDVLYAHRPEWMTKQVGELPTPMDMIGEKGNDSRKLATMARVRKKILKSHVSKKVAAARTHNKKVFM